jgi:serine/threonine-protein kinase
MNRPDESSSPPAIEETLQWSAGAPERDLTGVTLGDFQVERLLGRGGMGEVYLARQISLNRPVALKVLRPDLLTKPNYLSRFEAEATAVAKLNHPNIVHIYMLGSTDGIRYIAMEYVQGTNLRDYIRKKGALDYPLALSIMKQAGVAVGAAGEIGLIHRDIKPENLLLTRKAQVKIADFGLVRDQDPERVHLTQPGITMGTPLYMSPEQAQGQALDHRSDLYSLGVTFYHMIAGVPPFKGDSPLALALKHVKDAPASMSVHRRDVPAELDRLVLKLIAKKPADRYQTAADMLRDLAKVREVLAVPSGAQAVEVTVLPGAPALTPAAGESKPASSDTVASTRPNTLPRLRLAWRPPSMNPGLIAASAVGLFALGGLLGWTRLPQDLLADTQAGQSGMPGLWLAPHWQEAVGDRRGSVEEQYRFAQLSAPRELREAAWLAVPGYFPHSREWISRAYNQLARDLLRAHDGERLEAFASEVERWDGRQTHEKELSLISRVGVNALKGDLDGVITGLTGPIDPNALTDPALLELSLEVTEQAERAAALSGAPERIAREKLRVIHQTLLNKLLRSEQRDFGPLAQRKTAG